MNSFILIDRFHSHDKNLDSCCCAATLVYDVEAKAVKIGAFISLEYILPLNKGKETNKLPQERLSRWILAIRRDEISGNKVQATYFVSGH